MIAVVFMTKKFLTVFMSANIFFATANAQETSEELWAEFEARKNIIKDLQEKDLDFSLEARYFSPSSSMRINTANANWNGGTLDLKKDLNLVNKNIPEIIFRYKNFSIDYLQMQRHGENFFAGELNLDGKSFSGGTSAKNNFQYIKFNVDNDIISLMGTGAFWSYGLAGIYWRGSVENFSGASQKNYFVPMPTVGLGIYMAIMPKMKIYLNFSGMFMGGKGHLRDFESGLRYSPSKNFTLTAGFRSLEFNINNKGNGDFKMNGPFIGLRSDF